MCYPGTRASVSSDAQADHVHAAEANTVRSFSEVAPVQNRGIGDLDPRKGESAQVSSKCGRIEHALERLARGLHSDEKSKQILDVAVHLAGYLVSHYPALLIKRFGPLPERCDGHGLLTTIAQVRCLAKKAGGLDIARAATTLLNEFRSGALGPISLGADQGSSQTWLRSREFTQVQTSPP